VLTINIKIAVVFVAFVVKKKRQYNANHYNAGDDRKSYWIHNAVFYEWLDG
jgi:hypothetical protein